MTTARRNEHPTFFVFIFVSIAAAGAASFRFRERRVTLRTMNFSFCIRNEEEVTEISSSSGARANSLL